MKFIILVLTILLKNILNEFLKLYPTRNGYYFYSQFKGINSTLQLKRKEEGYDISFDSIVY